MPNIPSVKSYQQILKDLIQAFLVKSGVTDLAPGSAARSLLEAQALSDFRSQGDVIQALNSIDIDRQEGPDLDNIGFQKGFDRPQATATSGQVKIYSKSFKKISTKIYAGTAAPPIGVSVVNISDASGFPATGSVYIGRGSNNLEGPLAYTSITQVGNYFQLNLATPTTKNHNVSETVILAQGGIRQIPAGTMVRTKENSTSPSVQFRVLANTTIPDGEDSIINVPVVCTAVGSQGNVQANAITEFSSEPFIGAGVQNLTPFVTGRDVMSDVDYRLYLKNAEQTKTKGTDLQIRSAAVGTSSSDDAKTVTSASIRKPAQREEPATLFIDDGTAYQPIFSGQGFEQVVDNANGGEKYLQLNNEDITKAMSETSFFAPFVLTGGQVLAISVGGERSEHTFSSSDFKTQNAADTFEVVNSINQNTALLFSARSSDNGKRIVIFAKDYKNEDITVVAPSSSLQVNANEFLGFPENQTYSLRLYKNDELLIKDGVKAIAKTRAQSTWAATISPETITIKIDKQSSPVTYTIQDADFAQFSYPTVSSSAPIAIWAEVINSVIPGITQVVNGNTLEFTSNKGASDDAKVEISGGTLRTKIFDGAGTILSTGAASDYSFNRSTGQVELVDSLASGDYVTAGSKNTRAFVLSGTQVSGQVSLVNSPQPPAIFVTLDDPSQVMVPNTAGAGSTLAISNPSANIYRFTSSEAAAFSNVLVNDWVVLADDSVYTFDPDFLGYWRVVARTNNSFDIRLVNSLGLAPTTLTLLANGKIAFVRSQFGTMQKILLPVGAATLNTVQTQINSQIKGGVASVFSGKQVRITSNTFDQAVGAVLIPAVTSTAQPLGFTAGSQDFSQVSHTGFSESQESELTMPLFVNAGVAVDVATVPVTALSSTVNPGNEGVDKNSLLQFLNPAGTYSPNKNLYAGIKDYSGGAIDLRTESRLRDAVQQDRFYFASPFNFEANDSLVQIIDKDTVNKSLSVRLSRKGQVNGTVLPTQTVFRAYDADAGPTANFPNAFGDAFNFNDYKVHFQARQILNPSGANNKMLVRALKFGPSGESIRVGIDYPTVPNASLSSTVDVKEKTDIKVFLSSGAERLGGGWDSTTQFNVSFMGGNTYRYSWNTIGTNPQFTLQGVVAGDVVHVKNTSPFTNDNTGTYVVTAVSSNYFEVINYYGVVESGIQILGAQDLRFYPLNASANKASDIQTYVSANLAGYISISQLESGAGVISTSTSDDQSGVSQYVNLVDGEAFVHTSTIGTTISPTNQFQLKSPLQILESDPHFTLVGEEFYLIPTRTQQLKEFLSVFAVTGLSSLSNIVVSSDAGKLQVYSTLFGSSGAVQISGGSANSTESAIISSEVQVIKAEIEAQPNGISRNGALVTVNTSDKHDLAVGAIVNISGTQNSTFEGEFTVTAVTPRSFQYNQTAPTLNVTSSVRASNVITATTSTSHLLTPGDKFTVSGNTDGSFDGQNQVVISTPTATTFTYANVGANASSTGGSITNVGSGDGAVLIDATKVKIDRANFQGLQAGQFVHLENSVSQGKALGLDAATTIALSGSTVTRAVSGTFQTQRTHLGDGTTVFKVEKQGRFVCITWLSGTNPQIYSEVKNGDWIRLTGNFNANNQGVFQIVRRSESPYSDIWIENVNAVEEEVTLSANTDIRFYSYDSVMPGDEFVISSDVLGSSNQGSYTVSASPFPTSTTFNVSTSFPAAQSATAIGSQLGTVQVKEKSPYSAYKKILNIVPDPDNANGYVVVLDKAHNSSKLTVSAGGMISAVSKLQFKTSVQVGEDSYKYYRGLISAVGKKIRGKAEDPVGFQGVAAAGSYIEITAPLPRRIQISLVVRNLTGVPFATIKSRVQNAVQAYINSLGVGEAVTFSRIVSVVQELNGVQALAVSSPTYDSTSLQIVVNEDEKAVVTDATVDVVVSLST